MLRANVINRIRNATLTGVSFGSRDSDSESCLYRLSRLLQQRKLCTDASKCQLDLIPGDRVRWK